LVDGQLKPILGSLFWLFVMTLDKNEPPENRPNPNNIQLIWGIALVLAGLGVFYRIPQVMPKIASFKQFASSIWFIRFCFYFMGIILIGGGIKKIWNHFKES
jgi:hypothetical protein